MKQSTWAIALTMLMTAAGVAQAEQDTYFAFERDAEVTASSSSQAKSALRAEVQRLKRQVQQELNGAYGRVIFASPRTLRGSSPVESGYRVVAEVRFLVRVKTSAAGTLALLDGADRMGPNHPVRMEIKNANHVGRSSLKVTLSELDKLLHSPGIVRDRSVGGLIQHHWKLARGGAADDLQRFKPKALVSIPGPRWTLPISRDVLEKVLGRNLRFRLDVASGARDPLFPVSSREAKALELALEKLNDPASNSHDLLMLEKLRKVRLRQANDSELSLLESLIDDADAEGALGGLERLAN